jgi:hypothetical protein
MTANEKTAFGVTVETTPSSTLPAPPPLRAAVSHESTLSSVHSTPPSKTATPRGESDHTNPFSAFYKHPDARRSMDDNTPTGKSHLDVYTHDLESGVPISAATTVAHPKVSIDGRVKECTMWPSKQTMLEKAKARKRERGCNPMRSLDKKQKLWCKIFIALFIVAAAVGLGVGISRAVGGGVWTGNGKTKQIPGDN